MVMEKFKRTFSLRPKKKTPHLESAKPHQWQEDERKMREGSCSFQVKYLGCVEVFESRGIQICEEAVKVLKGRKSRSAWSRLSLRKKKKDDIQQSKSGHHRAAFYVTGDALRVVDEISKGLIVDQTIEKVSFCGPDRNHEKGFAYICRDGTTRRWMCHGFMAIKESGERLSHAVGCAFAVCLEKKQQREKDKVTVTFNDAGTSFTRLGSFRQTTITERLADPQSAILAEPVPTKQPEALYSAVQRPHAPVDILERQGSFRGFNKLADSSPFKRNVSLRLSELPSTKDRQRQLIGIDGPQSMTNAGQKMQIISTIMEDEELPPSLLEEKESIEGSFTAMKLNVSSSSSTSAVAVRPHVGPNQAALPFSPNQSVTFNSSYSIQAAHQPLLNSNGPASKSTFNRGDHFMVVGPQQPLNPQIGAVKQTNPWSSTVPSGGSSSSSGSNGNKPSEAENWLNSTANCIDPFAGVPTNSVASSSHQRLTNGTSQTAGTFQTTSPPQMSTYQPPASSLNPCLSNTVVVHQHNPHEVHQGQMVTSSDLSVQEKGGPSGLVDVGLGPLGPTNKPLVPSWLPTTAAVAPAVDPFDSAWATKSTNKNTNPFQPTAVVGGPTTPASHMKM